MDPTGAQNDRLFVASEGYMQNSGTSVPPSGRHGWGRKVFDRQDFLSPTQVDNGHHVDESSGRPRQPIHMGGNRRIPLNPPGQIDLSHRPESGQAPRSADLKMQLREILAADFSMAVFDELKWAEVAVEQHGCEWAARALSKEGRSLAKEGKSARALADKLSMTPSTELRQFGLRHASLASGEAQCRSNKSMMSPGIHSVLGNREVGREDRDPEETQRRNLSSGKDNFQGYVLKDEAARPQGKRFIAERCHIEAGTTIESDQRSRKGLW